MLRQDPITNEGGEKGPVLASGFAVRIRTRTVLRCLEASFFLPDSGQTLARLLTLQAAPDFSCSLLLLATPCCTLLHLAPSFSFYTPSFRVTGHAVLLWAQSYTNEDDISWRKFTFIYMPQARRTNFQGTTNSDILLWFLLAWHPNLRLGCLPFASHPHTIWPAWRVKPFARVAWAFYKFQ